MAVVHFALLGSFLVGGARLATIMTRGTNLAGGSTGGTISTVFRTVRRTVITNGNIRMVNFNGFCITRHSTHINLGPRAGRGVRVPTSGTIGFGTNTTLGTTIGWVLAA